VTPRDFGHSSVSEIDDDIECATKYEDLRCWRDSTRLLPEQSRMSMITSSAPPGTKTYDVGETSRDYCRSSLEGHGNIEYTFKYEGV
jgi:hypothetical protein